MQKCLQWALLSRLCFWLSTFLLFSYKFVFLGARKPQRLKI
ncbi:putative membrane protein [Chlamydia muridarum]|nr:putative membrane protein [Chlamydia muridarum]KDU81236.1 putative membrane protein [Chlamydia muridarum]KDU82397.1 putative membrane protein [Chlamydia muridarum]KDU83189.1 putative membrane protein [Chlamydia muridarum]KDU84015.1 putative membrane protein [Chlamydia muridarum]